MNSFSGFGGMMGRGTTTNTNTILYIEKYAKNPTVDFSGSSYTDLSATTLFAKTASGINIADNKTTFARIRYNNTYMKTSDFGGGSFTIYLKHAARYSTLCPFNFQNPNVIQLSQSGTVSVGSSRTLYFYSTLNPGTTVPYLITGCTPANLSNAALSGNFVSPYTQITYTIASGAGSTVTFNVSGGLSTSISII